MREIVTGFLRANSSIATVYEGIVLLFALFLVGLAVLIFIRRAPALTFLSKFASTPRINALEAVMRFLTGIGFMGASPDLRFSSVAFYFGLLLAATAVPMLFLPKAHARYGKWSMKVLPKILSIYALVALSMGVFILYALF